MRALAQSIIARTSRRRVWAAFFVVLVVQAAGGLSRTDPAVARAVDAMPDIHPGYDGAGLVAMIGKLADDPMATAILYGLDMLNPTTGSAFIALLMAQLLVAMGRPHSGWHHVFTVLLLAVGLDVVENASVLALVAIYPSERIADVHGVLTAVTVIKMALLAACFLSMVLLIIAYARRGRAKS